MSDFEARYSESYALIIGINIYMDSRFTTLGNATSDAQTFASVLEQPPHNFTVNLLVDNDATRQAIFSGLDKLQSVAPNDRVMFYFTGHGYTLVDHFGGRTGYVAASDTVPDQHSTAIKLHDITEYRWWVPAKHFAFVFDACCSGEALGIAKAPTIATDKFLMKRRAYQVLCAGAGDQTVPDYDSMTETLVHALGEGIPDQEGTFTFSELGLFVRNSIAAKSRQMQIPQFGHLTGSAGGDFVFFSRELDQIEHLLELEQSSDRAHRLQAIHGLGYLVKIGDVASETALVKLEDVAENDPDNVIRSLARAIISELIDQGITPPLKQVEVEALFQEASDFAYQMRWEEALAAIQLVLKNTPDFPGGAELLSKITQRQKQINDLESAVRRHIRAYDWKAAQNSLSQLASIAPDNSELSTFSKRIGLGERAAPLLRRAYQLIQVENWASAQHTLKKTLEIVPDWPEARQQLDIVKKKIKEDKERQLTIETERRRAQRQAKRRKFTQSILGSLSEIHDLSSFKLWKLVLWQWLVITVAVTGLSIFLVTSTAAWDLETRISQLFPQTPPEVAAQISPTPPSNQPPFTLEIERVVVPESPTHIPTTEPTMTAAPPTPVPTISQGQLARQLAEAGVGSTNAWEPVIEKKNGVEMALVPVGCFQMGSTDGNSDEQPVHEVCFEEPFWIDVYEVTNEQFGSLGCEAYSSEPDQPRNCVDWLYSLAHCESRGARLPTEAEWEYAARGPDGLIFPWGNDFVADNVVYIGNSGSWTWEVGSKPGGVSWIGAFDLSGNVWEWVNDWYDSGYYGTLADGVINPQGPGTGHHKVFRGGSWGNSTYYVRAADRDTYSFSYGFGTYGFRCALSYGQ